MRRDKRRRQKRRQRAKKVRILGTIIVLIVFGLFILGFIKDGSKKKDRDVSVEISNDITNDDVAQEINIPTPIPEVTTAPEEVPIEPEIIESISITVSAVGDCTLGTDEYFDSDTSFVAKYNEVGYPGYFFENVRHIFENDDLTIANFEGTLTDRGTRKDKTYAFRGAPKYAEILTEGKVDAVNLANNHSFDYGEVSYQDTKQYLGEVGITCFGYDNNAVIEIKGVKVGLIGIYELAEGIECAGLLKNNISEVKNRGAQLIIVSFHWGTEKEHYPDSIQKELAHIAIDCGAHLVLGHHPHVLQGIEEYKGRNIVYSLGNFCFGGNKNPSDKDTMIFQQTFQIIDGAVYDDNMKKIIPCSLSSRSDRNNYRPMILEGEDGQRVMDRIHTYSEDL